MTNECNALDGNMIDSCFDLNDEIVSVCTCANLNNDAADVSSALDRMTCL